MKLRPSSLAAVVFMLGVAACGGSENIPDAEPPIDATVDAVPPPDAYVCPFMECGTPGDPDTCIDTSQDEQNCGDCDMACQGGAICDTSNCECPAAFLAANHTATGFDQFLPQGMLILAIGPEISGGGINGLAIGYANPGTVLGVPTPLSGAMPGTPPFAAALYNIDAQNQTAEAAYYAVDGMITFTAACAEGVAGTIDGVTFQGATLFPPEIDPDGCTFTMPSINFVIGADCPAL